jgi:hypothetical protein
VADQSRPWWLTAFLACNLQRSLAIPAFKTFRAGSALTKAVASWQCRPRGQLSAPGRPGRADAAEHHGGLRLDDRSKFEHFYIEQRAHHIVMVFKQDHMDSLDLRSAFKPSLAKCWAPWLAR